MGEREKGYVREKWEKQYIRDGEMGKSEKFRIQKKRRKRQNLDSGILALLFIEYGPPRKNAR